MIKCSIPGKTASLTLIPLTKNLSFKTVLYSCEEAAFLQKLLFFSKHVYKPFFLDDFSHLSRTHTDIDCFGLFFPRLAAWQVSFFAPVSG
jgi:hypothetical protein